MCYGVTVNKESVENMNIFVDADACPVVGIVEKIAEKYDVPVTLLCDTNHVLASEYSEVIMVGAGADAHGDAGVLVAAHQPAALLQKLQVLGGGAHLKGKAALGVIGAVPVEGHPHIHPAHAGKGVCVQNVQSHSGSGRMPASIG